MWLVPGRGIVVGVAPCTFFGAGCGIHTHGDAVKAVMAWRFKDPRDTHY
jgi:hypothetical protein